MTIRSRQYHPQVIRAKELALVFAVSFAALVFYSSWLKLHHPAASPDAIRGGSGITVDQSDAVVAQRQRGGEKQAGWARADNADPHCTSIH